MEKKTSILDFAISGVKVGIMAATALATFSFTSTVFESIGKIFSKEK